MFAPTLCYELRFPRTPARRKRFIFKRIIEVRFWILIWIILFGFSSLVSPFWSLRWVNNGLFRWWRIALRRFPKWISNVVWNVYWSWPFQITCSGCLAFTHCSTQHWTWWPKFCVLLTANFICKLLAYVFLVICIFSDFWNSETITYFWRTWNIPVHRWAVRHVYKPIVNNGYSKLTASVVVFFVSAFFHEYLVCFGGFVGDWLLF